MCHAITHFAELCLRQSGPHRISGRLLHTSLLLLKSHSLKRVDQDHVQISQAFLREEEWLDHVRFRPSFFRPWDFNFCPWSASQAPFSNPRGFANMVTWDCPCHRGSSTYLKIEACPEGIG